jgi:Domain of unknown function (DUF4345)
MARIFLIIAGLMWLAYGVYMLMAPGALAGTAGVGALNGTGTIELRAMYGGLEGAVGLLALWGALDPRLRRAGLAALAFTCSGLGSIRLTSALLAGEFSTYTKQGLGLEIPLSIIAIWLLVRDLREHP